MFRLLIFLAVLALAAAGLSWLAENPGDVTLTWRGVEYQVSLMLALGAVAALALALSIVWGLLRWFRCRRGRTSARRDTSHSRAA